MEVVRRHHADDDLLGEDAVEHVGKVVADLTLGHHELLHQTFRYRVDSWLLEQGGAEASLHLRHQLDHAHIEPQIVKDDLVVGARLVRQDGERVRRAGETERDIRTRRNQPIGSLKNVRQKCGIRPMATQETKHTAGSP